MLEDAIRSADNILVVTGAGISTASGIQAWRTGEDAVWANDVLEKGTQRYFNKNPAKAWEWYLEKFKGVFELEPNDAHKALAEIGEWCESEGKTFDIITQNVDHLHNKAGSQNVIEIHGTTNAVRCPNHGCDHGSPRGSIPMSEVWEDYQKFGQTKDPNDLPCCPKCEIPLRAHALWFDEFYGSHEDYRLDDAMEAIEEADMVVFIGTSFSVGITNMVVQAGRQMRKPMYIIDPNPSQESKSFNYTTERAEDYLPNLVQQLTVED
jgi:NAD-dependent deacetylase